MEAVLGLGTNIGDRLANIRSACAAIERLPKTKIVKYSSLYETAPVGCGEQPDFLNGCVRLETALSAHALLGACLGIESAMGRERPFRYAPRVIDIDLLLYEKEKIETDELWLPHPRITERAFVLYPLREVLAGSRLDFSCEPFLSATAGQEVRRTEETIHLSTQKA